MRIELDYQQPGYRSSRTAGWLLLVIGLALLVELGVSYDRLHSDREAMNQEISTSKIRMDRPRNGSTNQQFTDKDLAEARQIIKRISTPWDAFFAGIESVSKKNVAILTIEPDMQTGLLRIEGEARDYASVLTLVAKLRTTKPFSEVFLLSHEIKRNDPQHPVWFTVSMRWVKPL